MLIKNKNTQPSSGNRSHKATSAHEIIRVAGDGECFRATWRLSGQQLERSMDPQWIRGALIDPRTPPMNPGRRKAQTLQQLHVLKDDEAGRNGKEKIKEMGLFCQRAHVVDCISLAASIASRFA